MTAPQPRRLEKKDNQHTPSPGLCSDFLQSVVLVTVL